MTERLRTVIIGCGGMSSFWLDILKRNHAHDLDLVGFSDVVPGRAEERANGAGFPDAITGTDFRTVLDESAPDLVIDISPPEAHHGITLAALERGCHVLGEKPLADSMDHAREMVAAAERAGRLYAVMQNRRYAEPVRRMKQLVADRRVGPLTTVHADFFCAPRFGGFRDEMDHVLLLDMAIHHFDMARCIIGSDAVAVRCHEWNPPGSWYAHGASAVAVFEMENGVVYTYRGSWCADGLPTSWECDWRIIGQQGTARWDGGLGFRAEVAAGKPEGSLVPENAPLDVAAVETTGKEGGHEGCIAEFIRCVRTGGTPETIAADNIRSLAMVFGAIESAETGQRVAISS